MKNINGLQNHHRNSFVRSETSCVVLSIRYLSNYICTKWFEPYLKIYFFQMFNQPVKSVLYGRPRKSEWIFANNNIYKEDIRCRKKHF